LKNWKRTQRPFLNLHILCPITHISAQHPFLKKGRAEWVGGGTFLSEFYSCAPEKVIQKDFNSFQRPFQPVGWLFTQMPQELPGKASSNSNKPTSTLGSKLCPLS
jgi:hypothetical protein